MSRADTRIRMRDRLLRRLVLIRPFRWRLSLGLILLIVTAGIQLVYPKAISFFIDHSIDQQQTNWLVPAVIAMGAVLIFQAVAASIRHYLFTSTGAMIVAALRKSLYGTIVRQEIGFFDRQDIGNLTNRLSSDVELLQHVLTTELAVFLQALLIGTGSAVMLIVISPQLSLLILIIVPVLVFSARWMGVRARRNSALRQEKLASCGHIAQETFSNIRLVHAFTQETNEHRRYARATDDALRFSLACNRLFAGFAGVGELIRSMAVLMTLWFGGQLVAGGALSIGELTSFVLYAGMAAGTASTLSAIWGEWMNSIGATDRVFDLLDRAPRTGIATSAVTGKDAGPGRGGEWDSGSAVSFESVTFAYPTRPQQLALDSIDLRIKAGEKVALVGPSGAGKTSVVNILLGFYMPSGGVIRLDGVDARTMSLDDRRKSIAIVAQEPALFSGTIIDNLRYGAPGADVGYDEIMEAAVNANVHDFVSGFPEGYHTLVGNRGVQLSGGQKQRIAIARALLRRPKILILDEATSALDSENESKVQSALEHLMKGRTTLMIAHRFSTINYADRMIVMDGGRIVQSGTHDQLMKDRDGLYFELMKNQIWQHRHAAGDEIRAERPGPAVNAANRGP